VLTCNGKTIVDYELEDKHLSNQAMFFAAKSEAELVVFTGTPKEVKSQRKAYEDILFKSKSAKQAELERNELAEFKDWINLKVKFIGMMEDRMSTHTANVVAMNTAAKLAKDSNDAIMYHYIVSQILSNVGTSEHVAFLVMKQVANSDFKMKNSESEPSVYKARWSEVWAKMCACKCDMSEKVLAHHFIEQSNHLYELMLNQCRSTGFPETMNEAYDLIQRHYDSQVIPKIERDKERATDKERSPAPASVMAKMNGKQAKSYSDQIAMYAGKIITKEAKGGKGNKNPAVKPTPGSSGKSADTPLCRFFAANGQCKKGDSCNFSHGPKAKRNTEASTGDDK
jgi:hypothetical protein